MNRIFPIVAFLCLIFAGTEKASAQFPAETHTFTGPNGQTLEAEILDFVDRKVIIRRLSDGQRFELPADRLAPADVDFMRAWLAAREESAHPADWKRLRIHLPEFADEVEAPGIPEAFRRVGLHTWEAELPEGAWVLVKLARQPGNDFAPQFLLPFVEQREWFLTYEEEKLFRSGNPESEKVLTGLTILADDDERALREMKKEIPSSGVAIYSGFIDEDDLSILGSGVFSVVVKKLRSFSVTRDAGVRALRVTEALNEFDGIGGWEEVEFLEAPHSGDFPMAVCAKLKALTTLIADGKVSADASSGDGAFSALRHLSLSQTEIENSDRLPAFLAQLENLESLSLPDETPFNVRSLAVCPKLTAIELGDECADPGAEGLGGLKNLTTVLLNANYTPGDLAPLLEKGHLSKVRTLRTDHPVSLGKAPFVRNWILHGNRDGTDFSGLVTPPGLTHLRIRGATDEDIAALGEAGPNLAGVRFVSLSFLNCSTLDPLNTISRLKFLDLDDQFVTADQKLTALEPAAFPALRGLSLTQLQNLAQLTVSDGSQLEALSIRACGELAEIRSPVIPTFREISISNCGVLRTLGGLETVTEGGIKQITGSPRLK